jgi:hypothetical protein
MERLEVTHAYKFNMLLRLWEEGGLRKCRPAPPLLSFDRTLAYWHIESSAHEILRDKPEHKIGGKGEKVKRGKGLSNLTSKHPFAFSPFPLFPRFNDDGPSLTKYASKSP